MDRIAKDVIEGSLTYNEYLDLIEKELAGGRATGGQTDNAFLEYSRMNLRRMRRLNKTLRVDGNKIDPITSVDQPLTILTITEGWCGDAAQIIPVIEQLAKLNPMIVTRYILRDENPDVMDGFLTGESRSIPIVIIVNTNTGEVICRWGPRPTVLQERMINAREEMQSIEDPDERKAYYLEALEQGQLWYNRDKGKTVESEFLDVLDNLYVNIS